MSVLKWFFLLVIIAAVAAIYWYIRRQGGSDPWQGMDEPHNGPMPPHSEDQGHGDSYIVGVRTLNRGNASKQNGAADRQEPIWDDMDAPSDEPRQPTAVRRRGRPDDPPHVLDLSAMAADEPESSRDDEPEWHGTERLEMVAPEHTQYSQIFRLYITAEEDEEFSGPAIHKALVKADLHFGLNDLYHRVTEEHGVVESVYCVTNMLKPGTLDPKDQQDLLTPGLAMFIMVPAVVDSRRAMRDMMETGHLLATELGGRVLDDHRALLKAQTAQYMLEQAAEIDRRAQLSQQR